VSKQWRTNVGPGSARRTDVGVTRINPTPHLALLDQHHDRRGRELLLMEAFCEDRFAGAERRLLVEALPIRIRLLCKGRFAIVKITAAPDRGWASLLSFGLCVQPCVGGPGDRLATRTIRGSRWPSRSLFHLS